VNFSLLCTCLHLQVRGEDDLSVVESARFYTVEIFLVAANASAWYTIYVFKKKNKRRPTAGHAITPNANGPLAHHGANSIAVQNSTFEAIQVAHTATLSTQAAVDAVVSGAMHSLDELRPLAPKLVEWLKLNLPKAHEDPILKHRMKALLGAPRFVSNLDHFGMWDDLIQHCEGKALEAGHEMKVCFEDGDLATTLGEKAMPNAFSKVQAALESSSSAFPEPLALQPCDETDCFKTQAALLQVPYPYNKAHSQLWNEKCFAHFLRMVAMGIDQLYQNEVKAVCTRSNGDFRSASIKGFVRMINKIMSKNDHYYEAWPR
jgi:hypothetical protein